jgi:antitoxin (DNA-binding transcriptional repressor) of toxin-antitoxin stability system
MLTIVRVPIAGFKYNMRPFVDKAKAGEEVIVTCDGKDEFRIVPVEVKKPQPLPLGCATHTPDVDKPAFGPLDENESLA